ncbi:MAG: peptidase [Prolixibacteraceae bacterium]|nr:peptidase [Prolixibacteraceae bacterium]MBT6005364.1 peptidase [Prolixibacteraceae bacterium]MBT6764939.1 peptidase [Prolixibacteraceae bacterium]MBT6997407.1 peptidase [Prolixibacteraceae bacterium]MBT7396618.1 peptidase [Prolixibacteraceae bacterium]
MLGRKATDDGSVITAHTCDAYYRTWLEFVPAQKFERDTTHKVYWGTMHTHTAWSRENLELKGEIPQAKETYAYLNTAYPCLNEKQLAIGETTIGGHKELKNENGLFLIEELERIVLQRCTNAREAIRLIGELIKEYGYGDSGECITIADTKEVWQLEIFGEGPDQIGGVWAAQRIPDNHVGVSANLSRIAELDLDNEDYFMASENVFEVAKNMDFWDEEKPFKYWEVYSGKKPFTIREFYVFNTLASSLNLNFESDELPFSVKVDEKVNVRQVLELYRETYDGTEYEMIRNLMVEKKEKDKDGKQTVVDTIVSPAAHPWLSTDRRNLLNSLEKDAVVRQRPISVQYCAYSWIAQLRDDLPDEIGGRIWFSFDVPRLSPRIPIYCGNLSLPESFNICGQDHFSRESAVWGFRRANRLAMVNWGTAKDIIEPEVAKYEDKVFGEIDFIEKRAEELLKQDKKSEKNGEESQLCKEFLTDYSNTFARSAIDKWWELGDELWVLMRWKF